MLQMAPIKNLNTQYLAISNWTINFASILNVAEVELIYALQLNILSHAWRAWFQRM